jgi:hypothetical protein
MEKTETSFFFRYFLTFQTLVGLGNVIQSLIFSFRSRCAPPPSLHPLQKLGMMMMMMRPPFGFCVFKTSTQKRFIII